MTAGRSELLHRAAGDDPHGPRLLLLPPAGAGASIWRRFGPGLSRGWSEILTVCMPGRERRFDVLPFATLDEAVATIARAVPSPRGDMIVFGHSLGGLVGFGVVASLERRFKHPLGALIIAGRGAPCAAPPRDLHRATDAELAVAVEQLGGTPLDILRDPEAWALHSAALRADFKIAGDWRGGCTATVETPMTILSGRSDPATCPEDLRAWQRYARGPFRMRTLPGSHFFPFDDPEPCLRLMRACADVRRAGRGGARMRGKPDAREGGHDRAG